MSEVKINLPEFNLDELKDDGTNLGTFKSVKTLKDAYDALRKSFTKNAMELAKIKKEQELENFNSANIENDESNLDNINNENQNEQGSSEGKNSNFKNVESQNLNNEVSVEASGSSNEVSVNASENSDEGEVDNEKMLENLQNLVKNDYDLPKNSQNSPNLDNFSKKPNIRAELFAKVNDFIKNSHENAQKEQDTPNLNALRAEINFENDQVVDPNSRSVSQRFSEGEQTSEINLAKKAETNNFNNLNQNFSNKAKTPEKFPDKVVSPEISDKAITPENQNSQSSVVDEMQNNFNEIDSGKISDKVVTPENFSDKAETPENLQNEKSSSFAEMLDRADWSTKVENFFTSHPSAREHASEIATILVKDKAVFESNNPLISAWVKVLEKNSVDNNPKKIENEIRRNPNIREKIIEEYLLDVKKKKSAPTLISNKISAPTKIAGVRKKIENMAQAKELAKKFFK